MHKEQLMFVNLLNRHFVSGGIGKPNILEIGSYDVNGSIRSIFEAESYVGVDLMCGPGVDVVASGHEISLEYESYDLAISCECFEHNPYWRETFINMIRHTKKDGIIAISCGSKGRREHGTKRTEPNESPGTQNVGLDYYKNLTEKDFVKNIELKKYFKKTLFYYSSSHRDLYFVGFMPLSKIDDNSIDLFINEVKSIDKKVENRTVVRRLISSIYNAPIWVAMNILNDEGFQNFLINYRKLFRR